MKKSFAVAVLGLTLAATLSACGGDDDNISQSDRKKASQAALAATGGGAVTDAGKGDGDDDYAYEVEVTFENGVDIDVELDENFEVTNSPPRVSDFDSGTGSTTRAPSATKPNNTATTPDGDADDKPLKGTALKKASDAALEATGGGKVTETGGSDEADHVYEVDVLLENGEDVTVELDGSYKVTKIDR